MKYKFKVNTRQKELNEYLSTEESTKDFGYCIANGIEWNSYLTDKGLIKEEFELVDVTMPKLYPLRNENK